MIFGIGVDVLEAQRMRDSYARFGARLLERLLLPQERRQFDQARSPERFLAMRFAAKEAIVKAMGTGFAHGVWIRDVGVVQNHWGKPEVIYSARGERVRRRLGVGEGHITLTDEAGLVVAVAVLLRDRRPARRSVSPGGATRARTKAKGAAAPRPRGTAAAGKRGPGR
jgi:holo-[acyl-carrier protein] synthase